MVAEIKSHLTALVKELEMVVPYAAGFFQKRSGQRIQVNRVQEAIDQEDRAQGLVFTLWNGQSFFEYATNDWSWEGLRKKLVELAKHTIERRDPSLPDSQIDPGPKIENDFESPVGQNPKKVSWSEKLELAKDRLQKILSLDSQVANVLSILGETTTESIFVNRHKQLSQKIVRMDAMVVVYVSQGKEMREVHDGLSKNGGWDAIHLSDDRLQELVSDGKRLLQAERLLPGVYDTITDPEWSGIIAHECFGHGMETDLYVRDRALSQRYLGKQVASSLVNMFDDPSMIEEAGGFFFDDEGQLAQSTCIIKAGILQRGLTDLASAHKLKLARSANGRRESYARKVYARMTNTFFEKGTSTKEEMISSIENGLYLRHATNGMEDPQAWGIQVEGLWAEEIKGGKLTGKIFSPIIMTGFVPDLLKSISMVGNDRTISGLGMCGKGHKEWVKNTTGGPHLKMMARLA